MEKLYHESNALPYTPREGEIKALLLQCLEHHYGSLREIKMPGRARDYVTQIDALVEKLLHMDL